MNIYRAQRMRDGLGRVLRFVYLPDGSLYDSVPGEPVLRVGRISKTGVITVRPKYGRKHGDRLKAAFDRVPNQQGEVK